MRTFFLLACLPFAAAMPVARKLSTEVACDSLANDGLLGGLASGASLVINCPSGCFGGNVWGSERYTDDSVVCKAAMHATGQDGGEFTVTAAGGKDSWTGTTSNGVTTTDYGPWSRGFNVVAGTIPTAAPVVVTEAPVVVTEAPVVVTEAPVVVTEAPVVEIVVETVVVSNATAPAPVVPASSGLNIDSAQLAGAAGQAAMESIGELGGAGAAAGAVVMAAGATTMFQKVEMTDAMRAHKAEADAKAEIIAKLMMGDVFGVLIWVGGGMAFIAFHKKVIQPKYYLRTTALE